MIAAAFASSIAARASSAGAVLLSGAVDAMPYRSRRRRDRLSIALLAPFSGPAGLWGPSCQSSAMLAAREINESGGLLGR